MSSHEQMSDAGLAILETAAASHITPLLAGEYDRVASLRAHAILDTGADPSLDEIVRDAAIDLDMPIARVSLIDSTREWTKAAFGLPMGFSVPRGLAFCSHTVLNSTGLTVVPDAALDPRFDSNPYVIGNPGIRFYAGAPLQDVDGNVLGALSVMDMQPRELGADAAAKLSFLAGVASTRIALYRADAALRASEEHYRSAVDLNPLVPWTADADGLVAEATPRWLALTGLTHEEARAGGWIGAVHARDKAATLAHWEASRASGTDVDTECRCRNKDGVHRWFRLRATAKRNAAGEVTKWYGTMEDIHDRKIASLALQDSEFRFRHALEIGGLGAWEYFPRSRRIMASDQCAKAFGRESSEEIADYASVLAAVHPDDRDILENHRLLGLAGTPEMDIEFRVVWPGGSVHWVRLTGRTAILRTGEPRVFGLAVDVTERRLAAEERERAQARLEHAANHDALTGIANRRSLEERLQTALAAASAHAQVALLAMDLDDFKAINETMGHEIGDRLLQQTALRLAACAGPHDTVARIGGDEFAVLMTNVPGAAEVRSLSKAMLDAMAMPFDVEERQIILGGSIGAAIAEQPLSDPGELSRKAYTALHRAKRDGRNTCSMFDARMDKAQQVRDALKAGFHDALARNQLRLHYQPVIDLATGRVNAFEALMRWDHPERGLLAPDDFVPIAEETGWVSRFGRWALLEACAQAATWPDPLRVAVNLSVAQFNSGPLIDEVVTALARSGLAADRLELEVTESLLLRESDANLRTLETLRRLGVRLVMDDFGTGYSSLAYLRRFKFDKIKVDRSLISGLPDADGGDVIVRAILSLGRSLGIAVTAEGVENERQLAFLKRNKCAHGQGFLFSRPVAASLLKPLMTQRWNC